MKFSIILAHIFELAFQHLTDQSQIAGYLQMRI